ncbi:unnamed protein product [Pylaiella littoralis]
MGQTEKLVGAVQTLSDAVVAKQRLDEEAAGRAREMAAEQRRATKIKNLKGEYELSDPESAEYFALRAALRFTFRQPLTDFLDNPASAATTPASGAGGLPPRLRASHCLLRQCLLLLPCRDFRWSVETVRHRARLVPGRLPSDRLRDECGDVPATGGRQSFRIVT